MIRGIYFKDTNTVRSRIKLDRAQCKNGAELEPVIIKLYAFTKRVGLTQCHFGSKTY